MAIASFSDLKSSIAAWAHRTDLNAVIPDFVALAEARLYDLLLLKDMEAETTLTTTVGANYVALPSDYISPLAMWLIVDSDRQELIPALPQELPYETENSIPSYWAVDGTNIRFDCPADSAYSAPFRYVAKSSLSDANTTNYLLSRRPDIYLAASMVEAARYTQDAELFNTWEPRFLSAVQAVKAAENRARAAVTLRTDVTSHTRSNIITGDA